MAERITIKDISKKVFNCVIHNNVSSVIASVSIQTKNADHFIELKKIPLVMFNKINDNIDVSKVVKNLLNSGFNRIVHITGLDKTSVFRNWTKGYQHMIKKLAVIYNNNYIVDNGFTIEEGKQAAKTIFKEKKKPNAIICDSNILMVGILAQLKEMNIDVPKDVKIISFGNNPVLNVIAPYISSITQPISEIGKASFELLLKKIQGDDIQNENQIFKAKINYK